MEETDLPHGKQPAPKVRVFSVELDRRVEAADRGQRLAPHGEVAAVEDRPDAQQMLDEELRGGGQRDVVCANQHPPPPVPVVIAIGSGQRDQPGVALESPFDPLDPRQRRAAVRIEIDQDVARRAAASRLTRDHKIPRHRCAIVVERRGIPTRICVQPDGDA